MIRPVAFPPPLVALALHPRRARAFVLCFLLPVLPLAVHAQTFVPDTSVLAFRGVPAGAALSRVATSLRQLGGGGLRCTRSRSDPAVQECRGTYRDSTSGLRVEIWLSAIDSLSGILTFKAGGTLPQLEAWRNDVRDRYGPVKISVQGPQRMMQWVRRGRMIRITWRPERSQTMMSVSLVDGRVLDDWGRRRKR